MGVKLKPGTPVKTLYSKVFNGVSKNGGVEGLIVDLDSTLNGVDYYMVLFPAEHVTKILTHDAEFAVDVEKIPLEPKLIPATDVKLGAIMVDESSGQSFVVDRTIQHIDWVTCGLESSVDFMGFLVGTKDGTRGRVRVEKLDGVMVNTLIRTY